MTAEEILATSPWTLFPGDEKAIKTAFHGLLKKWHPDYNKDPRAASVTDYLIAAKAKVENKTKRPTAVMERRNGTKFQMEYIRLTQIDGLTIYTGQSSIAYFVPDSMCDLVARNANVKWTFATPKMETEMVRFLPSFVRTEDLKDGKLMIYRRKPNQILMSDLIQLHAGRIPPLHVSWMLSRLNNLACYLEWFQHVDFAILPEYLLVDLDSHGVSLCGPRLFMTETDKRPIALSARAMNYLPTIRNPNITSTPSMDRSMIRSLGCMLLGDPSGVRLPQDALVKKEVAAWLVSPPAKTAVADYEKWVATLGERKFLHFGQTTKELYA